MLKEKMQMIKSKYQGKTDKKKIESLVVFIIILIVTLIAINTIWKDGNKTKDDKSEESPGYKILADNTDDKKKVTVDELETKLEEILSKMEGVGKVNVMLTYSKGSEIVPMQNENSKVSTTQETDSEGGTRVIEEKDTSKEIVYSDGSKIETQTVINPVVKGAIVIAEGASNATVKSNIISAVEAITGLATYKVQVFEMN
ncbi:MAG: hypothetical protein HFJ18_03060 [Clostridia bacterium]|nr:hypothetical protein [Clostridia bacterium]